MASAVLGSFIMFLMCSFMQMINNSPNGVPEFYNLLYLLVHRPMFIAGFTMVVFPILVAESKASPLRPAHDFLSHAFWVPFSRLTYGALISHGIWMQFREFNNERGTWGSGLDAFLFFLAYLTFSFLFSFATAMIWEQPIATLWFEFVQKPMQISDGNAARETYYQAAPSSTNIQSDKVSMQDVIASKKAKLLGDDSGDAKRRKKQVDDVDAEDLEDGESEQASPGVKK